MELNDIIKACQQNSRQAQQKLFELYQAKLFAVCLKYAATYDDAQDGFQDGFIQIFKTISQYSGKGSFEGWLKRVMVTTILQQYRMKKLQLVSDDNISEKLPEEEEVLLDYPDELLDMHYLTQLIQGLPDKYRLVFSMYVLDGFTHKEISEMLGISEGTSKSNLSRAKQLLKERIESNRTALLKKRERMKPKSLETVFQERLANHQVDAPAGSWEAITAGLDGKKKKRRVVLWWTSAAAILALSLGGGTWYVSLTKNSQVVVNQPTDSLNSIPNSAEIVQNEPLSTPITEQPEDIINMSTSPSEAHLVLEENNSNKEKTAAPKVNRNNRHSDAYSTPNRIKTPPSIATRTPDTDASSNAESASKPNADAANASQQLAIDAHSPTTKDRNGVELTNTENKQSLHTTNDLTNAVLRLDHHRNLETALALDPAIDSLVKKELAQLEALATTYPQADKSSEEEETKSNRNWQVGLVASPIFTQGGNNASPVDPKLIQAEKSYNTELSIGVAAQYQLTERWRLKTGVNKLNMSMNTHDLYVTQAARGNHLSNVTASNPAMYMDVNTNSPLSVMYSISNKSATMKHQMEYLEIPTEVAYVFFQDRKWNAHVAVGASTLFHLNNSINLAFDATEMNLGRSSNINTMHFSGNLGLGLQYNLWRDMALQIEPQLRYHLNSFDATSDFKPLNLGVSTGIFYRF